MILNFKTFDPLQPDRPSHRVLRPRRARRRADHVSDPPVPTRPARRPHTRTKPPVAGLLARSANGRTSNHPVVAHGRLRPGSDRVRGHPHRHIAASNEGLVIGRPVRNAVLRLVRGMDLRLHPCSVAPAEGHEKCAPPTQGLHATTPYGAGEHHVDRRRQIFRTRRSGISMCRGMASTAPLPLTPTSPEIRRPHSSSRHPRSDPHRGRRQTEPRTGPLS